MTSPGLEMIRSRSIGLPPASFPGLRRGDSAKDSIPSMTGSVILLTVLLPRMSAPAIFATWTGSLAMATAPRPRLAATSPGYDRSTSVLAASPFARSRSTRLTASCCSGVMESRETSGMKSAGFPCPVASGMKSAIFPCGTEGVPELWFSLRDEVRNIRLAHGKSPGSSSGKSGFNAISTSNMLPI